MNGPTNRPLIAHFLMETFDLSVDEFQEVNRDKKRANDNGMSDLHFWMQFGTERGQPLPDEWKDCFYAVVKKGINPNGEMYALVEELKDRGLTVGLLSNVDIRRAGLVREQGEVIPPGTCRGLAAGVFYRSDCPGGNSWVPRQSSQTINARRI